MQRTEVKKDNGGCIETVDFGEMLNSTIVTIFGSEMTYNDLKFYAENSNDFTYLKVEFNRNEESQLVKVWFNTDVVMDKKYSIYHSCDMFYYLGEYEAEMEEQE